VAPEAIAVTHFHLKYFSRTGPGQVNFSAVFYSQIDALRAAGLANATRGDEPGYYGIQECRRVTCENPRPQAGAAAHKRRPAARKGPLPPSEEMLD
jgi:hypothetical protein